MRILILPLVAIVATATGTASAGPNPPASTTFAPAGKWSLEGNAGRCILSRDFTAGTERVTLAIEPLPLNARLTVSLKTVSRTGSHTRKPSTLGFDDGKPAIAPEVESFDSTDGVHRVHRISIERTDLDRASLHGTMTATLGEAGEMRLMLPQFSSALAALDGCERTIVENVGLAPTDVAKVVMGPQPPRMLFRQYPGYERDAEKGDLEDEAIARYLIDVNGVPTNCATIHAAQSQFLNNGACTYMGKPGSNFSPARDAVGKPVSGLFFERTRWYRR